MSELGGSPAGWVNRRERSKAAMAEPEIVTRNGKPVSVILPIAVYEELLERVEDAEDIAWLKKARKKPMHYRPLSEYLADRKARV